MKFFLELDFFKFAHALTLPSYLWGRYIEMRGKFLRHYKSPNSAREALEDYYDKHTLRENFITELLLPKYRFENIHPIMQGNIDKLVCEGANRKFQEF